MAPPLDRETRSTPILRDLPSANPTIRRNPLNPWSPSVLHVICDDNKADICVELPEPGTELYERVTAVEETMSRYSACHIR